MINSAHLAVKIEAGSGLTPDLSLSRPADVLVNNWSGWSPAAFDLTVTSPLSPLSPSEASVTSRKAALVAEQRSTLPMTTNATLLASWVPLAIECYGHWGLKSEKITFILTPHVFHSAFQSLQV